MLPIPCFPRVCPSCASAVLAAILKAGCPGGGLRLRRRWELRPPLLSSAAGSFEEVGQ